jgi:cell division protein FtsB
LKNYPFLRNFYRHQAVISDRVQRFFFFLVLAGILYAFLLGDGGFVRIAMLRGERAELAASVAELERNEKLLGTEIERLKSSDYYVEKMGREKFGYIRPGDRVYMLIPMDDRNL